jgi:colicin import membrane protein
MEELQNEQQRKIAEFSKTKGQNPRDEQNRKAALDAITAQFDQQVSLLQAQKRQAEAKAAQDAKALADGKALEAQTKAQAEAIKAQEQATKAAADAAKAKSESDIKALEQSGKAREDAIAAQIAALQGQSPAARAASIGALTQQFAGNMGGSIQTALGTFRSGGSAVAERAYQEAKAQTEKQEKIVRLQEEMKQVQVDIRTKIDAMKGAA